METGNDFVYSAPIGDLQAARLILTSMFQGVRLEACPSTGELYQARFAGFLPLLQPKEGVLMIQPVEPFHNEDALAHIKLNRSIRWEIELRGGAQNLHADLREIRLNSLDILGDARQVELSLPRPVGASFLYVSGSLRDARIHRPAGVGMRLNVSGGMEKCHFDYQRIHAVRSETSLESKDFSAEDGYYHLTVTGSAKSMTVLETTSE